MWRLVKFLFTNEILLFHKNTYYHYTVMISK